MKNFDAIIDVGSKNLRLGVFNNKNKIIYSSKQKINDTLEKSLNILIRDAEKYLSSHIDDVIVLYDSPKYYSLDISIKKVFDYSIPIKKRISKDTDIYLVNSYGQTKSFYNNCKNVFLGGSIINHGGQNPLEATRYGCTILHGPNISNFEEIYNHLKKMKISSKIKNEKMMLSKLDTIIKKKTNSKKIQRNLKNLGHKILNSTYKEIKSIII